MADLQPYFYYIFIFFGLVIILAILIFMAYQTTKKENKNL